MDLAGARRPPGLDAHRGGRAGRPLPSVPSRARRPGPASAAAVPPSWHRRRPASLAERVASAATSAERAEVAPVAAIWCSISRRRVENARSSDLGTPSSSAMPRDTSPKRTPRARVRPARRADW